MVSPILRVGPTGRCLALGGDHGPKLGVLSLLVPTQVYFPLERPSAEVAGERLEPRVLSRVGDQVRALRESFTADCALMRFFT